MRSINTIYHRDLSKDQREELWRLEQQQWSHCNEDDPEMIHFLYELNHMIVAHVGVMIKEARIEGHTFMAAGICALITDKDYRGKGFASKLLNAARSYILQSGVDISVFTCQDTMIEFYEKAGWKCVDNALIGGSEEHPFSSKDVSLKTMIWICAKEAVGINDLQSDQDIHIILGKGKLW